MKILIITASLNEEFTKKADCILQINDTNEIINQKVRADSHLLEIALNDALIYVVKNYLLFDLLNSFFNLEFSDFRLVISSFNAFLSLS